MKIHPNLADGEAVRLAEKLFKTAIQSGVAIDERRKETPEGKVEEREG